MTKQRWHCFYNKRGRRPLGAWHMVYCSRSGFHVLCGREQLLGRSMLWHSPGAAKLCRACLLKLAWRGRVGW